MYEHIIKCSIWSINLNVVFFRFLSTWSKRPYGRSACCEEEKCGLSKLFRRSIAVSTSMDTTARSKDKGEFKFKIRVKTRVLSSVNVNVISS